MTIVLIIVLILVLGGGGYTVNSQGWGAPGFGGLLGLVLVILLIMWLAGAVHAAPLLMGV